MSLDLLLVIFLLVTVYLLGALLVRARIDPNEMTWRGRLIVDPWRRLLAARVMVALWPVAVFQTLVGPAALGIIIVGIVMAFVVLRLAGMWP